MVLSSLIISWLVTCHMGRDCTMLCSVLLEYCFAGNSSPFALLISKFPPATLMHPNFLLIKNFLPVVFKVDGLGLSEAAVN